MSMDRRRHFDSREGPNTSKETNSEPEKTNGPRDIVKDASKKPEAFKHEKLKLEKAWKEQKEINEGLTCHIKTDNWNQSTERLKAYIEIFKDEELKNKVRDLSSKVLMTPSERREHNLSSQAFQQSLRKQVGYLSERSFQECLQKGDLEKAKEHIEKLKTINEKFRDSLVKLGVTFTDESRSIDKENQKLEQEINEIKPKDVKPSRLTRIKDALIGSHEHRPERVNNITAEFKESVEYIKKQIDSDFLPENQKGKLIEMTLSFIQDFKKFSAQAVRDYGEGSKWRQFRREGEARINKLNREVRVISDFSDKWRQISEVRAKLEAAHSKPTEENTHIQQLADQAIKRAKDAYENVLALHQIENYGWPLQTAQAKKFRDIARKGAYQRFQEACDQLETLSEASHAWKQINQIQKVVETLSKSLKNLSKLNEILSNKEVPQAKEDLKGFLDHYEHLMLRQTTLTEQQEKHWQPFKQSLEDTRKSLEDMASKGLSKVWSDEAKVYENLLKDVSKKHNNMDIYAFNEEDDKKFLRNLVHKALKDKNFVRASEYINQLVELNNYLEELKQQGSSSLPNSEISNDRQTEAGAASTSGDHTGTEASTLRPGRKKVLRGNISTIQEKGVDSQHPSFEASTSRPQGGGEQLEIQGEYYHDFLSRSFTAEQFQPRLNQLVKDCCSPQDHSSSLPPIDIGQQLGNYILMDELGEGGFGQVFRGEHVSDPQKQVAIKVQKIKYHTKEKPEDQIKRFCKEINNMALLNDPNIVRLLGFGRRGKVPFLVMEYAPYGTLYQKAYSSDTPMSPTQVAEHIEQAACGLKKMHEKGFIHRDIKPKNLLLRTENEVIVGDLGLVAPQGTKGYVGTDGYMAPEQKNEKPCNHLCDQFGLAATAHELLSGRTPRWDLGFRNKIRRFTLGNTYRISSKIRSNQIRQVLARALRTDPGKRYPDVKSFAEELWKACGAVGNPNTRSLTAISFYRSGRDHSSIVRDQTSGR